MSCNGGHHRISINRYKNCHFVDIWNTTHIISFNKSTLDRKEGAIMNGQSRDIAALNPQGTKKTQPNHKNKTQKTKKTSNTVAINDKWSRMVRQSPLETWYIINWHHIYSFWSFWSIQPNFISIPWIPLRAKIVIRKTTRDYKIEWKQSQCC